MFAAVALLVAQTLALMLLVVRLLPGRRRAAAIAPAAPVSDTTVSVIVATLNEAQRVAPCLAGLALQDAPLLEVLVVDSNSSDGTREMVLAAAEHDQRFQLLTDSPLPPGWVGKVWALETGLRRARGEWVLVIDADTTPKAGMIAAIIGALREHRLDSASFAPRFVDRNGGDRWLQPSMLVTLIYRTGAVGVAPPPDRVLANGQCMITRRTVLETNGGFAVARTSFSDDVTLARHLASRGARVGFLDGSRIIDVESYHTLAQTWREWGRSFDLKEGTGTSRRWHDAAFIWLTMALPFPALITVLVYLFAYAHVYAMNYANLFTENVPVWCFPLAIVNTILLCIRGFMTWAIRGSYAAHGVAYWLSPTADLVAAVRLTLSTWQRPNSWRGRTYSITES